MKAMTRSEFISKLWEVYVGDKEAINFITDNYMEMQKIISKAIEYMEKELGYVDEDVGEYIAFCDLDYAQKEIETLHKILKGEE